MRDMFAGIEIPMFEQAMEALRREPELGVRTYEFTELAFFPAPHKRDMIIVGGEEGHVWARLRITGNCVSMQWSEMCGKMAPDRETVVRYVRDLSKGRAPLPARQAA